jgi:hypothetical protein
MPSFFYAARIAFWLDAKHTALNEVKEIQNAI